MLRLSRYERKEIGNRRFNSLQPVQFDPKFRVQGVAPPIIFARIVRPMNALYNFAADSFTQRNFVADFLQAKCDFTRKWPFAFLSPPFGGLGAKYDDHFRLIRNENEKKIISLKQKLFCVCFVLVLFQFLPRCMECRRGLAMRILSVRPSVCLSVCPSVTRVYCDKTVERSVQIFIPYERTFNLVF